MMHRFSPHTLVATLLILGSACTTTSTPGGSGGSGGATAKGGSGGSNSGGNTNGGAGNGGSQAGGGSTGGSTQPANCPNGETCGGELVGTWNVTSSCLKVAGDYDVSLSSLGCKTVPATGFLQVTGTWTANANGSYTDNTTTTGSITFPLEASCLSISSIPVECSKIASIFSSLGWKSATCSTNASGKCDCTATANQKGGIGVVSAWAETNGTYTASGSGLNTDDIADYLYCVAGSTLTLTPKPTILPVTGTVVLQKDGTSSGTGGAAGGAGGATTGSGGKSGSGGSTTGSGGSTTGTGGKSGTGGVTTGTGGVTTGTGGSTAGSGGAIIGSGGKTAGTGGAGTGGTTAGPGTGPCDIYAAASNKCVAAHSMVRALFSAYNGPLYQVKRKSDGTTKDIGVLSPGGIADSAVQDTFCSGTTCTITKVYDQSGNGNFISAQTSDAEDPSVRPAANVTNHTASNATQEQFTLGGKKVYSLYMKPGQAYWRDGSKSGMPTGSSPQGIYMVTSGKHVNGGCCFDYGNAATNRTMSGGGTMDALYFGLSGNGWGTGNGTGPWVMADLEGGLFAQGGGGKNDKNMSMTSTYVTAVEKNNGSEFTLRGSDATQGSLATFYKGKLPSGYVMKKEGAIVLGSGGDCCYSNTNASEGTFYEGAIVTGYPSDATDDAVHTNVVSAGYGK